MTAKFFALLTNQGAAKLANATALGTKVQITHMGVGDGGGVLPVPNGAQTALVNEKRRALLNALSVDAANSSQIIAEQIIPENEGGFWIREIGLYDSDNTLIAVANCPETYKPMLAEGSGRTQTVRMILIINSTDAVTLKIDPSVVLATRQYVDDKAIEVKAYADDLMAKHLKDPNPHPKYAQEKAVNEALAKKMAIGSGQLMGGTFISSVEDEKAIGVRAASGCQFMRAYKSPDAPDQVNYWQITALPETIEGTGRVSCIAICGGIIYLGYGTPTGIVSWTLLSGKQPSDPTLTAISGLTPAQIVSYLGISSNLLPVGIPQPWPLSTPPAGWIICNGASFSAALYPQLAIAYPSLFTPDMRGLFIRGWDNGRGYDPSRQLGTEQLDAFASHRHQPDQTIAGNRFVADYSETGEASTAQVAVGSSNYATCQYTSFAGGAETRPRNIALNYIVRAA